MPDPLDTYRATLAALSDDALLRHATEAASAELRKGSGIAWCGREWGCIMGECIGRNRQDLLLDAEIAARRERRDLANANAERARAIREKR